MAHRAIREYDGKKLLSVLFSKYSDGNCSLEDRFLKITSETNIVQLRKENPWLADARLVAKPDQLIKRRMKNNLVLLDASWEEAAQWVSQRMNTEISLDGITGTLNTFLVEAFRPHEQSSEYYLAIRTVRDGDEILFYRQGGIDVGDVDTKAESIVIGIFENIDEVDLEKNLLDAVLPERKAMLADFIRVVYKIFVDARFAYLEINPVAFVEGKIVPLDLAARLDDTASYEAKQLWGALAFPPPFGRESTTEEDFIRSLDENSGASLKLTVLNPQGRVWTLLAGGGASVVFTDTIADLGYGDELANYGEYSGNPTDDETYEYAKAVLDLMTREKDALGRDKVLIIGGGIANFTDVAKTFKGISKAFTEYRDRLQQVGVKVYVRRGGPNYREGLRNMKTLGRNLGVPIEVYGPETHMTRIVQLALAA